MEIIKPRIELSELGVALQKLDSEMRVVHQRYLEGHGQLPQYLGRQITGEEINHLNQILTDIQDNFKELMRLFNWIDAMVPWMKDQTETYNKFIDSLKANGAQDMEPVDVKEGNS